MMESLFDARPHPEEGPSCPGCGLPNYSGLCPVCRGDEQAYRDELQFAFGPWFPEDEMSEVTRIADALREKGPDSVFTWNEDADG